MAIIVHYSFEVSRPEWKEGDNLVPDYHPLSREDLGELITFAWQHRADAHAVEAVRARLKQAIPGVTFPYLRATAEGECIAKKMRAADWAFMNGYKDHSGEEWFTALFEMIFRED